MTIEIDNLLEELGLSLKIEGLPTPRTDKDWCGVMYNVALYKGDRLVLETTYTMGVGHFNLKWHDLPSHYTSGKNAFTREEVGLYYKLQKKPYTSFKNEAEVNKIRASMATKIAIQEKILPEIKDVLYSLISDGDVINYSSFEEWADNYGYDLDSRKAEGIYAACLKTGLALRNGLGDAVLSQLQEAFQDY